ncbi:MAG: hypothetical protein EXR29_10395 [Betaproteobacteria bacterium]|nr:hypothetical protein [Betaproteobacteria bacterium]
MINLMVADIKTFGHKVATIDSRTREIATMAHMVQTGDAHRLIWINLTGMISPPCRQTALRRCSATKRRLPPPDTIHRIYDARVQVLLNGNNP